MGAKRTVTSDAVYEKNHANYMKRREAILLQAKDAYQKNKVHICAAMKVARKKARETRLQDKRRILYGNKHLAPTGEEKYATARDFVIAYKTGKPCMDCDREFPPCAMDFDHVRGDKKKDVSSLTTIKSITAEIAKCDLVCANCHRIRTFKRAA